MENSHFTLRNFEENLKIFMNTFIFQMIPLIEDVLKTFEKNLHKIADSKKATDVTMWVTVHLHFQRYSSEI